MQIKAIVKSVVVSYTVTGLGLLLLAFLLFRFDLGEVPVTAGIVVVYILSCLTGGFLAGRIMQKRRLLWGIAAAFAYVVILFAVSFATSGAWDLTFRHVLTTVCVCLGGGALGGILS
jgi:putative membrane protein (TIGR04086 family)